MDYSIYYDEFKSVSKAYSKVVNENRYRILANHTYDRQEEPIHDFSLNRPEMSEVSQIIL